MKKNLEERECLLRTILGIYAMLIGFLFLQTVVGILIGMLGMISLLTGAIGWCPLYAWLRKSPIPAQTPKSDHDA
ncbi:MAG: DUF2892 domain-containing protein [Anaerolineae bacterium]|nr:DUF2892 domain-containing protein [Anaerolineae bacterium]